MSRNWRGNPWEKQQGETARAWAAFETYLGLGPTRTITEAAKVVGKLPEGLFRWAREWQWQFRADQHDAFIQQAESKGKAKAAEAHGKKTAHIAQGLVALSRTHVARLLLKTRREPDFVLGVGQAVLLAETAVKLDRLLAGESTDIQGHKIEGEVEGLFKDLEKYREGLLRGKAPKDSPTGGTGNA